ncbi:MAG TPA: holo-ACP synthase [Firmicutes bacterium]|nr:holo-ACP synthase [Bacillota bacterium]
MVLGIGLDIIEIPRIRELMERKGNRLIGRVFTPREAELCAGRYESFAGRFAAKEAAAKALGTGMRGISWIEVEILEDHLGKPLILLHGRARDLASSKGIRDILVSITHLKDLACAMAVATGDGGVSCESPHT